MPKIFFFLKWGSSNFSGIALDFGNNILILIWINWLVTCVLINYFYIKISKFQDLLYDGSIACD